MASEVHGLLTSPCTGVGRGLRQKQQQQHTHVKFASCHQHTGSGLSWDESLAPLVGELSHFSPGEDLAHLLWYSFSNSHYLEKNTLRSFPFSDEISLPLICLCVANLACQDVSLYHAV